MTDDLIERLRALSRHEHSDYSIGDEAADALEQARRAVVIATGERHRVQAKWDKCRIDLRAAREGSSRWRERYVAQLACYHQDLHGDMANDAIERAEKAAERIAMLDQARGKGVQYEA